MPPQPPPPPSVPSTPDQDERIIGQPSSEPLTTQPSILIHLSAQPTMEKEEAAQPSTQSIMVMKPQIHSSTELSAQKKMVKLGLTRERSSGQIWAPLALDWFQTWVKTSFLVISSPFSPSHPLFFYFFRNNM